jgi:hypothetical protein
MQTWLDRIKKHPLMLLLVVVSTVVVGLASFNSAVRELWQDFKPAEKRAAINGQWQADVTYDWPNARYVETLHFMGEDDVLSGSASFLQVPRGIVEGKVQGEQVQWVTHGSEMNDQRVVRYVYRGRMIDDRLELMLQIENASTPHVPIVLTARRMQ